MEGESDFRHWDELAPDLLGLIFKNLKLHEVLQVIPVVCKSWFKVVEGPYCWQRIDMRSESFINSPEKRDRMLQTLIKRSSGSLCELIVPDLKNDQMFSFIADNAGSLQTLRIRYSSITDSTIERVAYKFSSLTTLDMSGCNLIGAKALEAIGRNCKNLVSLSLYSLSVCSSYYNSYKPFDADEVRIIARTMPKLKHLSIAYYNLRTQDVLEILSDFPELELLNIDCCLEKTLDEKLLEEKYPKVKVTNDQSKGCFLSFDIDESDDYGSIHSYHFDSNDSSDYDEDW